jgi:hypothetical protein
MCTPTYIHTYIWYHITSIHAYIHTHTYIHHIHKYTHIHTCTYTHPHPHPRPHTHTNTQEAKELAAAAAAAHAPQTPTYSQGRHGSSSSDIPPRVYLNMSRTSSANLTRSNSNPSRTSPDRLTHTNTSSLDYASHSHHTSTHGSLQQQQQQQHIQGRRDHPVTSLNTSPNRQRKSPQHILIVTNEHLDGARESLVLLRDMLRAEPLQLSGNSTLASVALLCKKYQVGVFIVRLCVCMYVCVYAYGVSVQDLSERGAFCARSIRWVFLLYVCAYACTCVCMHMALLCKT